MAKLTEEELLFRKVEEKVKKAIFEYGLIVDGDRILIGLSGGKDSLALVDLLGRRSKIFRPRFEVIVTHIVMSNIPYRSDIDYLKSRADEHGLSFFVHEPDSYGQFLICFRYPLHTAIRVKSFSSTRHMGRIISISNLSIFRRGGIVPIAPWWIMFIRRVSRISS